MEMAPTPAYRKSGASTRSLLVTTIGKTIQITISSQTRAPHRPGLQVATPLVETLTSSILYLVDESSTGEEEAVS